MEIQMLDFEWIRDTMTNVIKEYIAPSGFILIMQAKFSSNGISMFWMSVNIIYTTMMN